MAAASSVLTSDRKRKLQCLLLNEPEDDDLEKITTIIIRGTSHICNSTFQLQRAENNRNSSAHVEVYVEEIVPRYSDLQFREHFRMTRTTFEELCEWLGPHFPKERTMSVEKKMLSTLWLISNKESFRGVADRFGVNKGRLHQTIMMVCTIMKDHRGDVIRWPAPAQFASYAARFEERCGLPGVVGAVDGTHIQIPGPSDHRDAFINRKGYPSMQLQVVCNADLLFLDVITGWPGSVHDCRVFRNSPLKNRLETGNLPPQFHLLGDSAYQLAPYLLVPFRDNGHLTAIEKNFNKAHSSTRVDVERAIGLLKGKFRRLKYLEMTKVGSMPYIIFAACVLHNFIIIRNEIDEQDIDLEEEINEELPDEHEQVQQIRTASQKRQEIAHLLM